MSAVREDHVEQAALEWLATLGWEVGHGPDMSPPDAKTPGPERDTYGEALLKHRLRDAIRCLNPHIPMHDAPLPRVPSSQLRLPAAQEQFAII